MFEVVIWSLLTNEKLPLKFVRRCSVLLLIAGGVTGFIFASLLFFKDGLITESFFIHTSNGVHNKLWMEVISSLTLVPYLAWKAYEANGFFRGHSDNIFDNNDTVNPHQEYIH